MKKPTDSQKNTEADYQSLREDFSKLNQDLQTILQHIKTAGIDLSKDVSREKWSKIENTVKEHPIQSIAISFGIGLLFSKLLRR